ncbi:transcriptional regulator [Cupriavidus sp. USMAA2-4]|uniref:MurR/RpiR family transcriptional regulator n=1 Tax=Cupriavidus sp. USMAA2-4 TaxID=876364 RepID=UPI0008A6D7FB|nr:MurR/RpiR family transcriptional regulator [Cupriavidus sp. USMAA2-4]AOY96055.1 transcriptional regulator [Cupriavidus sp. USMAA2-4]
MEKADIDRRIEQQFAQLPPKLQQAARHAIDHPQDIALLSMRAVAAKAALQSGVMLRLARQLGFDSYEAFREPYRRWLAAGEPGFSRRATALRAQARDDSDAGLLAQLLEAEAGNLEQTLGAAALPALKRAHAALARARRIYVLGLRSLYPVAYYFSYACGMCLDNVTLLSGVGGTLADELRRIGPDDALAAFSFAPYAQAAVTAVEFARERGAQVVAITDSPVSPIAPGAAALVLAATATPSLLPSVVPALAVAQTLAALLVKHSGAAGTRAIADSEAQLERFHVYAAGRRPA